MPLFQKNAVVKLSLVNCGFIVYYQSGLNFLTLIGIFLIAVIMIKVIVSVCIPKIGYYEFINQRIVGKKVDSQILSQSSSQQSKPPSNKKKSTNSKKKKPNLEKEKQKDQKKSESSLLKELLCLETEEQLLSKLHEATYEWIYDLTEHINWFINNARISSLVILVAIGISINLLQSFSSNQYSVLLYINLLTLFTSGFTQETLKKILLID